MNSSTPTTIHPALGTSLYYALKSVPAQQRSALTSWVQWWHEIAQIPFNVSDPGVAETKLRWWSQELQACSQGRPSHPLSKALAAQLPFDDEASRALWALCQIQVQGEIDLVHQTRWMDEASLTANQDVTTGAAFEGAALLLGVRSPQGRSAARLCGLAVRQAHQLARLGQDARAGWIQVPIDTLQAHDVKAHQLGKPQQDPPPGWPRLLAHLAAQAQGSQQKAHEALRSLQPAEHDALTPMRVLLYIHIRHVSELAGSGSVLLHHRVVLTPLRKWWIAQRVQWGWLR